MTNEQIKQILLDSGCEEALVFENPDYATAFIGISDDNRAIYDYDLMVEYLVKTDNISTEEAMDFIDYNTIRSLPYQNSEFKPIILYKEVL